MYTESFTWAEIICALTAQLSYMWCGVSADGRKGDRMFFDLRSMKGVKQWGLS